MRARRRPPGYYDLLDDLTRPGCPACRGANRSARKLLANLLLESVNDPDTRKRLRPAHGFCADHAQTFVEIARGEGDPLGVALLYNDLLKHVREAALEAARGKRRLLAGRDAVGVRPQRSCVACDTAHDTAETYVLLLADADPESELGKAARASDRGLCVPHLALGIEQARRTERLLDIYLRGEEELRADLEEFIRKQDTRFRHEETGREAGSWRRGVYWLMGMPVNRPRTD